MRIFSAETDRTPWNNFVAASQYGHLMQSWEWGLFKAATGWKVYRIGIEQAGEIVAGAQLLLRPLPFLPLTVAYIPRGPVVDLENRELAPAIMSAIHQTAQAHRAIFLKIEPNLLDNAAVHQALKSYGFRASAHTNQPRSTLVVDLTQGEAAIMANMRKKTRKLVRRAARNGVEVTGGTGQNINDFYTVLSTTSEIKGFSIPSIDFFKEMWQAFEGNPKAARLQLVKYQGKLVATKMMLAFGNRCMHLWGGTTRKGRDIEASYLSQWEAIRWALHHGYQYSDLWGIKDEIGQMLERGEDVPKEKQTGLWGIYKFKRGFGTEFEYYVGAYDYIYRPLLYNLTQRIAQASSVYAVSRWLELLQRR